MSWAKLDDEDEDEDEDEDPDVERIVLVVFSFLPKVLVKRFNVKDNRGNKCYLVIVPCACCCLFGCGAGVVVDASKWNNCFYCHIFVE